MTIDLRSDTVTKPTKAMLEAMFSAEVGDDVFGEDPTINKLEEKCAALFGMEAGLFCSSGTQTNQVAIKLHTQPGDEVICDANAHIYYYEGGGIAFNAGCSTKLLNGERGKFTAQDVVNAIRADNVHFPRTSLVAVENTHNRGGGSIYDFNELEKIAEVCRKNQLAFHLDGARIFNAIVETDKTAKDFGRIFDTISVCLSKGLGAPVGSVLLGTKEDIYKARRIRKVFGGGMRQAGYLAAAGIYALDNNITRLMEDHTRAKKLADILKSLPYVVEVMFPETNIIYFRLADNFSGVDFQQKLAENNIKVISLDNQVIRMVTHLDFGDEMLGRLETVLKKLG
ncbi:MAG: Low specificity L-threonine aldolase [Bacteroidia bacterium]|nr:Low specificity L-threonine aldolase [Bacteroidia bacterium]